MPMLEFVISDTAGQIYQVAAKRSDDNLTITCSCPKGEQGDLCKHRLALLHGDGSGLVSNNPDDVLKLGDLIIGTDVEDLMIKFARCEAELETVKHDLDKLRLNLAAAMMD